MSMFFNNPMLWSFAVAIVVPIWLFFLFRPPRQPYDFSATQFVDMAIQQTQRQRNRNRWLLLLLRGLTIMALAFAAAGPRFQHSESERPGSPKPATSRTHHVLAIDTSFSMNSRLGNTNRLETAKSLMKEFVQTAPTGDRFSLVDLGTGSSLFAKPSQHKRRIIAAIRSMEVCFQPATLPPILRTLADVANHPSNMENVQVTIVSDFAQHPWSRLAECNDLLIPLLDRATVVPRQIGMSAPNWAITEFRSHQGSVPVGRAMTIEARVQRFGESDDGEHPAISIALLHNGETITRRTVAADANGQYATQFTWVPDQAGFQLLELQLEPDRLLGDNRSFLVLRTMQRRRILIVGRDRISVRSLQTALEIGQEHFGRVQFMKWEEWSPKALRQFDCIWFVDPPTIDPALANSLERNHMEARQAVIISWGPSWNPATTPQVNRWLNQLGVIGIGPSVSNNSRQLSSSGLQHELVEPFRDSNRNGLFDIPIVSYRELELDPSRFEDVLNFSSGSPLVSVATSSHGRIALWSIPLMDPISDRHGDAAPWSLATRWWSFVPLVNETVEWVLNGADVSRNILVGDAYEPRFPIGGQPAAIMLPDGRTEKIGTRSPGPVNTGLWNQPGFYQVVDANQRSLDVFAAHIPNWESNLAIADYSMLEVSGITRQREPIVQPLSPSGPQEPTSPLFHLALVVAGVLLLAETVLAYGTR